MKLKAFSIPFLGLKPGTHKFAYNIDNTFFESFDYHEFNTAEVQATAILNKMTNSMELHLKARGTLRVACDVTNEFFNQPIHAKLYLIIKFGEKYDDDHDEILILPHGEHQINIAQYLYEMVVLAVPQKRIHPGLADGTLQSEILDKLYALQPKENKERLEDNIDPRWDNLKKLLTEK